MSWSRIRSCDRRARRGAPLRRRARPARRGGDPAPSCARGSGSCSTASSIPRSPTRAPGGAWGSRPSGRSIASPPPGLAPDRTLWLALDPAAGRARSHARGEPTDRLEAEQAELLRARSSGPTASSGSAEPERIRRIDAAQAPAAVLADSLHGAVRPALSTRCGSRLGERPGVADHVLQGRLARRPAELRRGRARWPRRAQPGRRGAGRPRRTGISRPVTVSAAAITSRTEKPLPLPRL